MLGTRIGKYEIVSKIGEGGMGEVYQAYNRELDRTAVIKVLKPELSGDHQLAERFKREARLAAGIRHSGIVDVLDVDQLGSGSLYILMEHLAGEPLSGRLARGRVLSEDMAVALIRQAADALAAAHEKGIVHRDLKPDNVFLVPEPMLPGGERVKLLDFGIAKLVENEVTALTRTGALMGTPPYMSPEQCRGASVIDHRSDLYSLGVILFEMVCGRLPFLCDNLNAYLFAHNQDPVPSVREINPAISAGLAAIIHRLLEKSPDARYGSARELIAALDSGWPAAGVSPMSPTTGNLAAASSPPVRAQGHGSMTTMAGSVGAVDGAERAGKGRVGGLIAAVVAVAAVAAAVVVVIEPWSGSSSGSDETAGAATDNSEPIIRPRARLSVVDTAPSELTAPRAGTLDTIAKPGSQVEADRIVATLVGHKGAHAALRQAEARKEYYASKLARAKRRSDIAKYKAKLAEKTELAEKGLKTLEALEIKAPIAGTVDTELKPDAKVESGQVVMRIKAAMRLRATFAVPDVEAYPTGSKVMLSSASAGQPETLPCGIVDVAGGNVVAECPAMAGYGADTEVVLQPPAADAPSEPPPEESVAIAGANEAKKRPRKTRGRKPRGNPPEPESVPKPRIAIDAGVVETEPSSRLPPVKARIRKTQAASDGSVIVTMLRGRAHGLDKRWTGWVLRGKSAERLPGGDFKLVKVTNRECVAKVRLPLEQVQSNTHVVLHPPANE